MDILNAIQVLISVLCMVESGGQPTAVNGDAVGILQIRPVYVQEVNRIVGYTLYTEQDRWQVFASKRMVTAMMLAQCDAYKQIHGEYPSVELLARWHNGGIQGYYRNPQATDGYWEKVKKEYKRQGKFYE